MSFLLGNWKILVLAGFILVCAAAVGVSRLQLAAAKSDLAKVTANYANFVALTKAEGEAQKAHNKITIANQQQLVKEKDIENAALHTALNDTVKRLRHARSSSSILPAAPPTSKSPNLACFSRADLDTALRNFLGDTEEIAIEGDSATIDLDTGKKWVKGLH